MAVPGTAFKVVFFFEGVQSAEIGASSALGWTETWYFGGVTGATLDAVYQSSDVQQYLNFRLACLSRAYTMTWVRISDEAAPRIFKVFDAFNRPGGLSGTPAQVQCAILIDMTRLPASPSSGEPTHHRNFLLRGLPATVINGNVLNPNVQGWPPILAFLNFMAVYQAGSGNPIGRIGTPGTTPTRNAAGNLGLRYADYQQVPVTISSIAVMPNQRDLQFNPDEPSWGRGFKFRVKGIADEVRLNKIWTVLGHTLAPTMVAGRLRRDIQVNYTYAGPGKATMTPVVYQYGLFSQYIIIGLRSKRTGRIFRQLRGRSSPRS
jgi:hypothetical protein